MNYVDVFNGDADGLCALHQLRLHTPRASTLVTGVKRDIALLRRVQSAAQMQITVLDISLHSNRDDVSRLLDGGAEIFYFDHHQAEPIPQHAHLHPYIDTDADICTSLIVNRYLQGKHAAWAVVAAYGDNLSRSAEMLAQGLGLSDTTCAALRELGVCLNYNAYGDSVADLFFDPALLYRELQAYIDPMDFIADSKTFSILRVGYDEDMARLHNLTPVQSNDSGAVYILPDAAWARRVSGVFANRVCNAAPLKAHAILTQADDGYRVSVRAPLSNKTGADTLCSAFRSGGGRAAAAGINHLSAAELPRFLQLFSEQFQPHA